MADSSICSRHYGYNNLWQEFMNYTSFLYWRYTLGSLMAVVGVLATGGNFLILLVFYKNMSLRTTSNKIIISITLADFLTGVIAVPIFAALLLAPQPELDCAWAISAQVLVPASVLSVAVLSFERMKRIQRLNDFRISNKVLHSILAIVWLVSLLLAILPMAGTFIYGIVVFVFGLIGLLVIIVSYGGLFFFLRKHGMHNSSSEQIENARVIRERKAAITAIIIVTCYLLTTLPAIIEKVIDGTHQYENNSVRGKAGILATSALFSNSVFNPILYVLRMPELRKEIKRLFISI